MHEVKILVLDTRTNERIKPDKYNTFWDENGKLEGIQSFFKIEYIINILESEDN